MNLWLVARLQHSNGRFGGQDRHDCVQIRNNWGGVSVRMIGMERLSANKRDSAFADDHGPVWELIKLGLVSDLSANAGDAGGVERFVHVPGAGSAPSRLRPCLNIRLICGSSAIAAGAVTGGKCRGFIQKEKFSPVPARHDRAFAPLPVQCAANPSVVGPAGGAKCFVVAVNDAPVAGQSASGRDSGDLSSREDAVLKGHALIVACL